MIYCNLGVDICEARFLCVVSGDYLGGAFLKSFWNTLSTGKSSAFSLSADLNALDAKRIEVCQQFARDRFYLQ